ncbi:MAG TPA: DNA-3-methyladenine glycosylase [Rubricoccaceae bacterium]
MLEPLQTPFFERSTLDVARSLLGTFIVYDHPEDGRLVGRVVETEAYTADDPAVHGWKATFGDDGFIRPEGRAAGLFDAPGTAYVYLVYYTSWLLNVVTEPEGTAGAVLIRAVEPVTGVDAMRERRPLARRERDLTNGPGKWTQAFGIAEGPGVGRSRFHGTDLTRPPLFFAADPDAAAFETAVSSRIGIARGVDRPYRFYVVRHPYVSPGVPSDLRVARKTGRL